jgi:alkylated DNA nucleotide flippase Atl1
MKKTWQQKIGDKPAYPKVLCLEKGFPCYNAVHKMGADEGDPVVIVNASEVAAIMQKVPRGKLITLTEICMEIARRHRVKACCTLVAGIHTMEIANAVEEMKSTGKLNNLPYWRTLKSDGSLNPKFPGGTENQKRLLEAEGYMVLQKGKNYFVQDFSKYLFYPSKI